MSETTKQKVKTVDGAKLAQGIYSATFRDGTVIEVGLQDFPAEVIQKLTLYGLKQKLDDAMALDAGSDLKDYQEELTSTIDALRAGQWTMRVAGEGVEGGLFARAYAKHKGIPLGEAKAKISALVEANLKANLDKHAGDKAALEKITERAVFNRLRDAALERDPDLKEVYDELKAAKGKKKAAAVEMEISL